MTLFNAITFANPWLLWALAALPVIWFLLRVTPPAPKRVVFPPLRLLLGQDVLNAYREKSAAWTADVDRWEHVTTSVNFDRPPRSKE